MPISSRADRFKEGKALRLETPRETHADIKGKLSRNALAILAESDRDRVPELVPERYSRMSVDAFAFLRGAAAVMAADLADQPIAGNCSASRRRQPRDELWRLCHASRQHSV